ncbi:WGR domain-containing protein [Leptospira noguchii]|uniref:WGR domain-containing protein n=1 Tax=Leptospira noguchii TaxID=28182 RepID=UPI0007739C08|nr:WGR domain-containing protein [Leptospira noguchii]
MKHHLIFKEGNSNKFWQIEVSGNSFTVIYGKTGFSGQTQTKNFDDKETCLREAKKLLSEKLKKGYIDENEFVKATTPEPVLKNHIEKWNEIIKSKDLQKELIKYFEYLMDTDGYKQILTSLFSQVEDAKIKNDTLTILFKKGFQLIAGPPGDKNKYTKWPQTFQEKMVHHSTLSFIDENRNGVFLQEVDLDPVYDLELDETELNEYPLKSIKIPMSDYSNFWIYHPKEKNPSNEPSLIFYDHGGILDLTPNFNIGAAFLKRCAELLDIRLEPEPAKKIQTNQLNIKKIGTLTLPENIEIRYIRSFIFPKQKILVAKIDSPNINSDLLVYYDIDNPSLPILLKSEKSNSFHKVRIQENTLEIFHDHSIRFIKLENNEFQQLKKIDGPMHGARIYKNKIYFSNSVTQWRGLHVYDIETDSVVKLDDAMDKYKSHVEAGDICIWEDLLWLIGQDEVILYQLQNSSVQRLVLKPHNTIIEPEVISMLDKNRIAVVDKNDDPDSGFGLYLIAYADKKINTMARLFPKKGVVAWKFFENQFYLILLSKRKNKNYYSFSIWQPDTNQITEYELPELTCEEHFSQGICDFLIEKEMIYLYKNNGEIFTITEF